MISLSNRPIPTSRYSPSSLLSIRLRHGWLLSVLGVSGTVLKVVVRLQGLHGSVPWPRRLLRVDMNKRSTCYTSLE
ncbi:unnamed protein product [Urochloa humidicola]